MNSATNLTTGAGEILVSVVIPSLSFDGGAMTAKAVASAYDTSRGISIEVIVIDDGSKDGSSSALADAFPDLTIIRNERSKGFTVANNQGLEIARGRFLLMLNNDAELLPGCLRIMVEYLEAHQDVAMVGPKLLLTDEPDRLDSAKTYLLPFGYVQYKGWRDIDDPAKQAAETVFAIKGACALVRIDLIREHGFFVAEYFAYFEETELCWRLWLLGYKSIYLQGASALHGLGKTNLQLPSTFFDYHAFKNRLATSISHFENITLLRALPAHIALFCAAIAYYIINGRWKNAHAVMKAFGWNITALPGTLRRRRSLQKSRVISDSSLMATVGAPLDFTGFIKHALHYGRGH